MLLYIVLGILLCALNVLLVFVQRSSRRFALVPGWIYTTLFLCLGGYLLYMLATYAVPTAVVVSPDKPQTFSGEGNPSADRAYLEKSSKEENKFLQGQIEREDRKKDDMIAINLFLSFLSLQSFYAAIGAFLGTWIVVKKKRYYYGFVALHLFLTFSVLIAKYLVSQEIR